MIRSVVLLTGMLCLVVVSGCQQARYVLRTADEGVVAIPSNDSWPINHREKAVELMTAHFPNGYVIDREEEVVVGMETAQHGQEDENSWFSGTVTTDKTEWRIVYRGSEPGQR